MTLRAVARDEGHHFLGEGIPRLGGSLNGRARKIQWDEGHRRGSEEIVEALDAKTGEQRWIFEYPTNYHDDFGFDEGPRASPVRRQ